MGRDRATRLAQPRYYALEVKSVLDFVGDTRLAESVGIDIAGLDDPETTIPLAAYYELLERAAALRGDPHFGCHFALHWHQQAQKRDRGAIGLMMRSSPNLKVMADRLIRYQRYWNSGDVYEVDERSGFRIRYRPWGAWREAHRHMAEKTVADIVAVVRAVDRECQPLAVSFAHGLESGACALESLMSVRPAYGAACTEIVLPAAVMEKPLPTADRALFRFSERYLAMQTAQAFEDDAGFVAMVHDAVQRALADGCCDQQNIARLLGTTGRTLQRRLSREGATLREIVDEIRKQRARALLESGVSVAEIGFALGYSEPAAFHHAFRRWYGMSPKAWSQKPKAASSAAAG